MWMGIVIVSLAVIMMVGPLMMMRPSKRQHRLANLRTLAHKHSLKVQLQTILEGDTLITPFYELSWDSIEQSIEQKNRPCWLLIKQDYSHGIHFHERWDWHEESPASKGIWNALRQQLDLLPDNIVGIRLSTSGLGCYWPERIKGKSDEDSIEFLKNWLHSTLAMIAEHHQ